MAVLQKIRELIPQLVPGRVMSDWEQAARNASIKVYPGIRMNGCWFQTQKYGTGVISLRK